MNKGLWVAIGLLVLALAWLVSVKVLYQPTDSVAGNTTMADSATAANTKIMMSLDKFKGFHHDADILLKELTVLKSDIESAIASEDGKLLGLVINNSYRVMDNVNINRLPTIAPFEVCDEALDALSRYAINAKKQYSNPNQNALDKFNNSKQDFDTKFAACQNIFTSKSVEALYQDYQ